MQEFGIRAEGATVANMGLEKINYAVWDVEAADLIEETILRREGDLTNKGALVIDSGKFKGRAPKDRFIVQDDITRDKVWWGDINKPFDADKFEALFNRVRAYLTGRDVFVKDSYVCADPRNKLHIRVVTETPWSCLFAHNMFLRPTREEILAFEPDWRLICAPGYLALPEIDGTERENFTIINFTDKIILIGGSAYTGEIKKSIFSVLNFLLPVEKGIFPMHASSNVGIDGDTAIFFGLSGTGKTTLSADPDRTLIGDDEHGWADDLIFNFEGGCYAKCIDLSKESEPQIYNAIKFGTLLENVEFFEDTTEVDYTNVVKTENTRASFPMENMDNVRIPSVGDHPKNIFFLTADAFGVLPPISKLSNAQAMYYFISGYTAKVAGTEDGITDPEVTFSAGFGAPFLPLHPLKYADMLGEKINKHKVNVWLINTGWSGGAYGVGARIKLSHTRAMIQAIFRGDLDKVKFIEHEIFKLQMPVSCPQVPDKILNPKNTWTDKSAYDVTANNLSDQFNENFKQFSDKAAKDVQAAAPGKSSAKKKHISA